MRNTTGKVEQTVCSSRVEKQESTMDCYFDISKCYSNINKMLWKWKPHHETITLIYQLHMLNNWTHKKHALRSLDLVCIFAYKHTCTQLVACIQFVCLYRFKTQKLLMFLHTCKIVYQTHMFLRTQRNTWNSKSPCRTPLWTPATKTWLHVRTHTHTPICNHKHPLHKHTRM